ncbi:MAG: hypothetical protein KH452_04120 [Clostridiales bacterium]|nr:hypothetical protein [Clostridiales bacterium]
MDEKYASKISSHEKYFNIRIFDEKILHIGENRNRIFALEMKNITEENDENELC